MHDDLDSVRLSNKLIAAPPVVLWPQITAAAGVPSDVQTELIHQLARDES
ncbi:MAG: hypothetical protein HUU20_24840 [Pirellulales bacterium]|nr:hypothetical protein [Pirellulales bacterium]